MSPPFNIPDPLLGPLYAILGKHGWVGAQPAGNTCALLLFTVKDDAERYLAYWALPARDYTIVPLGLCRRQERRGRAGP